MDSYRQIWNIVITELEKKYSSTIMNLWFNKLELVHLDSEIAIITTPDKNFVDLLNTRYADQISGIMEVILGFRPGVHIFSSDSFDLTAAIAVSSETTKKDQFEKEQDQSDFYKPSEDSPEIGLTDDGEYTFENFIVGSSNKFAHAAALAVANNPTAYNPLLLYGSSGTGKTHLMKAIANRVKQRNPNASVVFVKGEMFTNELIESINKKTTAKFKEKYRNADILLLDDVQFIAGKETTQEEFFHTFNALYDAHKQIILTSDRPPRDIQKLEERILTRFEGGLIVDIQIPDTELRIAIAKSKAELMNVNLSCEVLTFIGENVKNNVRQIEGAIKRLGAYSFVNQTPITIETVKTLLSSIIENTESPALTAQRIIESVSARYGIAAEEIKGRKRTKEIAAARHIAVYVIRTVTDMSLDNIGKIFNRDHSTMLSSIDVVVEEMTKNSAYEHEIQSIIKEFKA